MPLALFYLAVYIAGLLYSWARNPPCPLIQFSNLKSCGDSLGSAGCPNVAIYPLSHLLGLCCPWTRDVLPPSPAQMLWEAWYSDLGWADPATPSAHRNSASFVPLFAFLFFGGCFFFFFLTFSFSPVSNPVPQGFSWSPPCPSISPHHDL